MYKPQPAIAAIKKYRILFAMPYLTPKTAASSGLALERRFWILYSATQPLGGMAAASENGLQIELSHYKCDGD
jgi:hypothetical protein